MSLILDTNALIWLLKDSERLGRQAEREIEEAMRSSQVLISATSFWEIAFLVAKGRIVLGIPVDQWRVDALRLGFEEVPIDGDIAIESVALANFHGDPADRFIVATALKARASLVTSDARILAWNGPLVSIDARV